MSRLEQQLKESERAREALEKQLREERECAIADRAKLARLASRLSNLESNREVSSRLLDDNRLLREQFEVQEQRIQDLTAEVEKLRGTAPLPTVVMNSSQERLLEENARLRLELQETQVMLAKYTDELNQIIPGVELILTQYQRDNPKGFVSETMAAQLHQIPELHIDELEGLELSSSSVHELPPAPYPVANSSQQLEPRMAFAVEAERSQNTSGQSCRSQNASGQQPGKGGRSTNPRPRSNGKSSRHTSLSPHGRQSSLSPQLTYARAPPPALKSSNLRQGARCR
jgi:hypothetical protein